MSKVTKLIKHPIKFFEDAGKKKKELAKLADVKNPVFAFRINDWKRPIIEAWMPDKTFIYVPFKANHVELEKKWLPLIEKTANAEVLVWGMNLPEVISNTSKPIKYVEDGFIRSVELGSKHTPPLSLNFDTRTPYFNAAKASDLEVILSEYEFDNDTALMRRAEQNLAAIVSKGISKYNDAAVKKATHIFEKAGEQRKILVVGQVEDDASIIHGATRKLTNNELVRLARLENPDAAIFYKPHPDVLRSNRKMLSNPRDVEHICTVIRENISISSILQEVDHVYTITSQVGFEALMRGVKVTTLGCPFYSNWGLTDDRQKCDRRQRKLTIEQLFAGAYILYPQYFNPITSELCEIEDIIKQIGALAGLANKNQDNKKKSTEVESKVKKGNAVNALESEKRSSGQLRPKGSSSANNSVLGETPYWFNPNPSQELKAVLAGEKEFFLYMPWVAQHTDVLVDRLTEKGLRITSLDIVRDQSINRRDVGRFARQNPILYRKMVLRRLAQCKHKVKAMILTFDWFPAMRLVAEACKELNIPVVLIPHESVFADRKTYYYDTVAKASVPIADVVLGWGQLQKDIFIERGLPAEKFIAVGAPKFDKYFTYQPQLTKEEFSSIFNLDPSKKIILFAAQPLDSQFDTSVALHAQRSAIRDLMDLVKDIDLQLIIRMPPAQHTILNAELKQALEQSDKIAVDDASCYLVNPEEAVYHCDIVASVNSTMLFEAFLLNKMPLATKYVDFDQIWDNCNIPVAKNKEETREWLCHYLSQGYERDGAGMRWAEHQLSAGSFDGKASDRIVDFLSRFSSNIQPFLATGNRILNRLLNNEPVDVVGIPSTQETFGSTQKYLQSMLKANSIISSNKALANYQNLVSVDCFAQWGIAESNNKREQSLFAKKLNRPLVFIEDGFIRSLKIGLSGEPGLSIIIDDLTSYYDATQASRMETLLEGMKHLESTKIRRARECIEIIVENRISKYNHAPDGPLQIGDSSRRKVLLIDQRYGDQSVKSGLGSDEAFKNMLNDAIDNNPDADILIKQHPDAIGGGKESYYNNTNIAFTKYMDNVFLIDFDINPYRLLGLVSDVYVVTSGMGFEALMAGKKVHCYGVPFYSGWGLTQDKQHVERRTNNLSIEEVFYVAYIQLSRYYSPALARQCSLEEALEYFINNKS